MELLAFRYADKHFQLIGSPGTGEEEVLVDGTSFSRAVNYGKDGVHRFRLPELGELRLAFRIDMDRRLVEFSLQHDSRLVLEQSLPLPELLQDAAVTGAALSNTASGRGLASGHTLSIIGLVFKLFKSAFAVKIALAGSALAAWSLLFSWQFALILIAVIVFHEYGHLRAMQKCGMKTKGMYLIPFVGGVAVGERAKTCWQEVYISMMGPVFGLFMTVLFYIFFLMTGNHFIGLVASVSALVNLFNLLPVYPLDGGHVVKAMVLSGRRYWAFVGLLALSAVCFAAAVSVGFTFLSFFIVLGVIDLIASWRAFASQGQTPMNRYGILFSLCWYFVVVGIFLAIIVLMAGSGVPGTEIATAVLQS